MSIAAGKMRLAVAMLSNKDEWFDYVFSLSDESVRSLYHFYRNETNSRIER